MWHEDEELTICPLFTCIAKSFSYTKLSKEQTNTGKSGETSVEIKYTVIRVNLRSNKMNEWLELTWTDVISPLNMKRTSIKAQEDYNSTAYQQTQ